MCRFPQYFEQIEEYSGSYSMYMTLMIGKQKYIQLTLLVPEPSPFKVKIAIEKLTQCK